MFSYLFIGNHASALTYSPYARHMKDALGNAHYCDDMIQRSEAPATAPPDCRYAYTPKGFAQPLDLHQARVRWANNALVLYRGIAGCHFSLPRIGQGDLVSEGPRDVPMATMGAAPGRGTRWLPFAHDEGVASSPVYNDIDPYTRQIAMNEDVPVGFMLKATTGMGVGEPIAWYNDCEIGVRGPLRWGSFGIHKIYWMKAGQILGDTPWPGGMSYTDLPPTRPYQPGTQQEIRNWWSITKPWVQTMRNAGHLATL